MMQELMAKLALTIDVTQKHIDDGTRGSCGACPIALAIMDAISGPGWAWARVDRLAYFREIPEGKGKIEYWTADTPTAVWGFMVLFDSWLEGMPGSGPIPFRFEATFSNDRT